jgi:hypothetical protein
MTAQLGAWIIRITRRDDIMASTASEHRHVTLRRSVLLLACIAPALAACASTPPSPLQDPVPRTSTVGVETRSSRGEVIIRRDDFVAVNELQAPRAAAWQQLLEVWEEVGLPQPNVDARSFTLTVVQGTLHRSLGRERLSTYLNCGSSMSGLNADTHRVRLTVQALLEPSGTDASRLHVRVDATAQSLEGASAALQQCTSKGTLEALITRRVRERLAAARR